MKKITLFLVALLAVAAMQAQIIRVPDDYPTIQQGINAATPGDTVLVSEGRYYEQINFAGKKPLMVASLFLTDGDKNHIANTIIDGSQIANSDSASVVYFSSGVDTTSVLCGFTITGGKGTTIITPDSIWGVARQGGGIWISGSGAKIRNNNITKNSCDGTLHAGAICFNGGGIATDITLEPKWIVVENNIIDSNYLVSDTTGINSGAGILITNNCRIAGNVIKNNMSTMLVYTPYWSQGTGVSVFGVREWGQEIDAIVKDNLFLYNVNNSIYAFGGGMKAGGVTLTCINNQFTGNSLISSVGSINAWGAGLEAGDLLPGSAISRNIFQENYSINIHAGMYLYPGQDTVLVENNYFFNNIAETNGGGCGISNHSALLQNNVFSGNKAGNRGGAIYLEKYSTLNVAHMVTLINNSFSGNKAHMGGAIFSNGAHPVILNSVFWLDSAETGKEVYCYSSDTAEVAHSNISPEFIFGNYHDGGGNMNEDPKFTGNKYLNSFYNSPCIDQGVSKYIRSDGTSVQAPNYDIYGLSRPRGAGFDMGAYEHSRIIHIPADFPAIQQGIVAANPGDTVLVSDGIYYEQINFLGKKPLMVASEYLTDGDTNHIANTIIDGSRLTNPDSASVVYFISGEDTSSVLCGFTIQNGQGTSWFWEGYESLGGGGIYVAQSTAKISHNIITNNTLDDTTMPDFSGGCGGGIHVSYGFPGTVVIEENKILSNNVITNHLWTEGGGIYVFGAHSMIRNNLVTNNSSTNTNDTTEWAHGSAAGIICEGDTALVLAIVTGNLIQNNIATGGWIGYGGGMALWLLAEGSLIKDNHLINNSNNWYGGGLDLVANDINVRIDGNYFFGNSAAYGGAVDSWDYGSNHCLVNNVFRGNNATEEGGAIWLRLEEGNTGYYASMINNTFSGNHAGSKGGAIYSWDYNPVIVNSVFWENTAPDGNVIAIDTGYAEIAYSDIDTLKISGEKIIGGGNINADPLFSDYLLLTTEHWSPVVDKGVEKYVCAQGQTVFCPENDILGIPRPVGSGYDMGAYDIKGWGQGLVKITNDELRMMNYPNPFRASTTFEYTLTEPVHVRLQVFNSLGHLVAEPVNYIQPNGKQTVIWNSGDLPAGMYLYFIQAGNAERGGKTVKK